MIFLKKLSFPLLVLIIALATPACKAKKALVQPPAAPAPTPAPAPAPAPVEMKKPEPAPTPAPVPPPPAPDYSFSNIQFEFNSGVLKTDAYPILDKAIMEMKKDPTATFNINGYASAEGSTEHNMSLSVERANAVKTYLINGGVKTDNLTAKGYGESNPVSANTDEKSRALNRRVELKKI